MLCFITAPVLFLKVCYGIVIYNEEKVLDVGYAEEDSSRFDEVTQSHWREIFLEDEERFLDELYGVEDADFSIGVLHGQNYNFSKWIDVFYGTRGGHMFPGTTLPFSMCKMGVDVINSKRGDAYSGYQEDGEIVGVSLLHESGTGGSPTYGVVSQLPFMSEGIDKIDCSRQIAFERREPDYGLVGYYKVELCNNVTIEFSSQNRAGLYQYTFPKGTGYKPSSW